MAGDQQLRDAKRARNRSTVRNLWFESADRPFTSPFAAVAQCVGRGSRPSGLVISIMPFAPAPVGLAYFAAVKLGGYALAGSFLLNRLKVKRPAALIFGAARTALGLTVGVAVVWLLSRFAIEPSMTLFFVFLLPVRFAEWVTTIWVFFGRRGELSITALVKYSSVGIGWSYVLDIPAITAVFTLPGGAWIC
jgi:hypothetical protein